MKEFEQSLDPLHQFSLLAWYKKFNEELQMTGAGGLILILQQNLISPPAKDVFKISEGALIENVSKMTSLQLSIIDFLTRLHVAKPV